MTTVEAPVSHLRENPYEIAKQQLRRVAETFAIDPNLVNVLRQCKKALVVSVPVVMDDGTTTVFQGYRVTHNVARGPSKGGIRYHPDVDARRGEGARDVDDVEVRAARASRSAARRAASSATRSRCREGELQRMTRRFTSEIINEIGPERDIPAPDVGTDGASWRGSSTRTR